MPPVLRLQTVTGTGKFWYDGTERSDLYGLICSTWTMVDRVTKRDK